MGIGAINFSDISTVSAEQFFKAFEIAQKKNPHYVYVTLHPLEVYKDCKVRLLLIDNTAGLAIEKDGNIISVFKVGERKGVMNTMIPYAVSVFGGKKLDCFGHKKLNTLYSLLDFVPISKTKFDVRFKPEGWDIVKDGKPDIIFWLHKKYLEPVMDDILFGSIKTGLKNIPCFGSYDKAQEYRDKILSYAEVLMLKRKNKEQ